MNQKNLSVKLLFLSLLLLSILFTNATIAQTRSRILGVVKDSQNKEALVGVTVMVKGTYLGAATDFDGKFIIINVPVGTYEMQISMIGYTAKTLRGVVVSADRVTSLDIQLDPTTVQGQEVVVTAKADELHKEVSNTQMVVSSDQLQEASGVRQINAFLQKMPGISESNGFLTIRGGSADQTGTMVNGLAYNNAAVGNAETSIPMSAVEQISLLSGGYNAEYGNFRSGLINVTTKSGSQDGYHGTFSYSRNNEHMKRFGDSFYDANNDLLKSFLSPSVGFVGTNTAWADDPYMRSQHIVFPGWISQAKAYNTGKPVNQQAAPYDMFLLANWLHMTVPDYKGLASLSDDMKKTIGYYELSDAQKKAFEDHHMTEEGVDWNFDGGFGGPIPFIGKELGNATFYISNSSTEQYYVMPVVRKSQFSYTTLGTMKAQPTENITITYNGLWKRQQGVSPARPPQGDAPNAGNSGGFMSIDNVRHIATRTESPLKYAYDPPFFPLLDQTTMMHGVTINHVLSPKTFYELSFSYLTIKNDSPIGDNRDSSVINQIGPFPLTELPYGKLQFGSRSVRGTTYPIYLALPGLTFAYGSKEGDLYDRTKTSQARVKFDIASQLDDHHYLKGGFEYNHINMDHNFWEKWNTNAYNAYEFNFQRTPSQTGLYIQDQINYNEIVANVGVRVDYYYNGGGKWPTGDPFNESMFRPQKVDTSLFRYLASGKSYIWDIWEAYDKEHPELEFLQPIKNFLTVSPRIGVSFPITTDSKFYFNYGHFRSNPPYYTMYQYRYRYDKNGLYDMSNPNLEPPRTISYELGVAYNFYENYIMQISGYSKDVTGEAGRVTYKNAAGTLNYNNQANNRYEDIQGLEINISKNDNSWLSGWLNFNYMLKKDGLSGRSLVTDVTINNDQAGLYAGNETKTLPQPELNANITFRSPDDFGPAFLDNHILGGWDLTLFATYSAGDYFTWNPLGKLHYTNNMQWQDYYMLDLKLSKTFNLVGLKTTIFLDISNLLNIKVDQMNNGYAFADATDRSKYLASLHLPMYNSAEYDNLRKANAGYYIGGDDKIGDLRSADKSYIDDPNYNFWLYKQPRDIWFGVRVDF